MTEAGEAAGLGPFRSFVSSAVALLLSDGSDPGPGLDTVLADDQGVLSAFVLGPSPAIFVEQAEHGLTAAAEWSTAAQDSAVVALIKRRPGAPLAPNRPIARQVLTLTLERSGREPLFHDVHQVTRHALLPAVRQRALRGADAAQGGDAVAKVRKKVKELDMALLQCGQRQDIPTVTIEAPASVAEALQRLGPSELATAGLGAAAGDDGLTDGDLGSIHLEALGLEARVGDAAFVEDATQSTQAWGREIQKVLGVVAQFPSPNGWTGPLISLSDGGAAGQSGAWSPPPFPLAEEGSVEALRARLSLNGGLGLETPPVLEELQFWSDMEKLLEESRGELLAPPVRVTLRVLQAKAGWHRSVVEQLRERWRELRHVHKAVAAIAKILRDASAPATGPGLHDFLTSSDLAEVAESIPLIFDQARRLAQHTRYGAERTAELMQSATFSLVLHLEAEYEQSAVLKLPYGDFQHAQGRFLHVLQEWDRQFRAFREAFHADAGEEGRSLRQKLAQARQTRKALEDRLDEVYEFRVQHEKLRQTLLAVLTAQRETEAIARDRAADLDRAFAGFAAAGAGALLNVQDDSFAKRRVEYDKVVRGVDERLIEVLRDGLARARTAEERFRAFDAFNPLFFRERVRAAIVEYQTPLLESVREAVAALQDKFSQPYEASGAGLAASARDLPAVASELLWARQVRAQLSALLGRTADVLGDGWRMDPAGKELARKFAHVSDLLDNRRVFKDWLSSWRTRVAADLEPARQAREKHVLRVARGRHGDRRLEVNFDKSKVELFKEVRNLRQIEAEQRIPPSIETMALAAQRRYPIAMALQATLETYYHCRLARVDTAWLGTDAFDATELLVPELRGFRAAVERAFSVSGQVKSLVALELAWSDHAAAREGALRDWTMRLHRAAAALEDKLYDLRATFEDLAEQLRELGSCTYGFAAFQRRVERIQRLVDTLDEAGYSNLDAFVKRLNDALEALLADRLEAALRSWVAAFDVAPPGSGSDGGQTDGEASASEDPHPSLGHYELALQISLHDGVLLAEPSIAAAGAAFRELLQGYTGVALLQRRVLPGSLRARSRGVPDVPFRDGILRRMGVEVLAPALTVLEAQLGRCAAYVRGWLRYQALWDMSLAQLIDALGDDANDAKVLHQWAQVIHESEAARSGLERSLDKVRFGPLLVDYSQVQERVISRYASWSAQLQSTYAGLVQRASVGLREELLEARGTLEGVRIGGLGASTVDAMCYLQDTWTRDAAWGARSTAVGNGEKLLRRLRHKFAADWPPAAVAVGLLQDARQILERRGTELDGRLAPLLMDLRKESSALAEEITELAADWAEAKPEGDAGEVDTTEGALQVLRRFGDRTRACRTRLDQARRAQQALQARLAVLDRAGEDAGVDLGPVAARLSALEKEHQRLSDVWTRLHKLWEGISALGQRPVQGLKPLELRMDLEQVLNGQLLNRDVCPAWLTQYTPYQKMLQRVRGYIRGNAILSDVVAAPLKPRHWKVVLKTILKTRDPVDSLTVAHFWDAKLEDQRAALAQILSQAQGESAIEEFLNTEVRDFWQGFRLALVPFQSRIYLISCFDVLFEKLEEHGSGLASMKQSPHYKNVLAFQQDGRLWEERIGKLQAIFDLWVDVQRRWVYLVGIFASGSDIKAQLPNEYHLFRGVDADFGRLHKKVLAEPSCMEILELNAAGDALLKQLERMQAIMQKTQKALGDYLERQRQAFARFYFVGDDDLLEVVGNAGEPQKVAQHLAKMFAAIVGIGSTPSAAADVALTITSMLSREGESVALSAPIAIPAERAAKEWLADLEAGMRDTLRDSLASSLSAVPALAGTDEVDSLCQWMSSFPAQIITLAQQVQWSLAAEAAVPKGATGLGEVLGAVDGRLQALAQAVLRDLPRPLRKKCEHLITELVHKRDVQRVLVAAGVTSIEDFRWQKNLRFRQDGPAVEIAMANARFDYGYEYLGVGERLVTTPLTDRCYLTLTQSLHLRMGANPFGPAGTGKTESVKSLGGLLGLFTLVFCCDEAFDYASVGRIFVGLCQVGAWGCFDEFNRLEERILSAISQQILTIQTGLQEKAHQIPLCGKTVTLNPKVGIFVTMNPGYAGRSNLPDNLKRLFRAVAMVHPDSQLIAQVMLFGQGLEHAEALSARVVELFDGCKERLSAQSHYDFGLRALKSVLVGAGQLKRLGASALTDPTPDAMRGVEIMAMLRSVCNTMVPKLVQGDRNAFEELLATSFPDADLGQIHSHDADVRGALADRCDAQGLLAADSWVDKVMQLYNVLTMRHGVMLVGPSGSGKSEALRFLRDAHAAVDPAGQKVEMHVIDPKAMDKEALYGVLDPTTLEWTDGVFTKTLRGVLENKRQSTNRMHWIVFDGDVDPEWAENLNSVLDDNKLLTLPNGERLAVPANVRILMEVDSLGHATPATVSRCGMIWFSAATVNLRMLLWKTLQRLGASDANAPDRLLEAYRDTLTPLLVPENDGDVTVASAALEFALSSACEHIMEVTAPQLVHSLGDLLRRGLALLNTEQDAHPNFPVDVSVIAAFAQKYLIFALMWAYGASASWASREKLDAFLRERSGVALPEGGLLQAFVRASDGEWDAWSTAVPNVQLEPHEVRNADVVVTTTDVVRHREVLRAWLESRRSLLLCGPPGSGKTMTLSSTLRQMTDVVLAELNFSAATTADLLLKTFYAYCDEVRTAQGTYLQPKADFGPDTWLVVFCDEINLPAPDAYGTPRVLSFMRHIIEHGGFYAKNTSFVRLRRVQFVGACNPPTDVGRFALSARFLCLAPVLLVDFPSGESLQQIYGTFNAALLKLHPNLRGQAQALTDAMVAVYRFNQETYKSDAQPQYFYSPRELSRWVRGLYETLDQMDDASNTQLVRLWAHEAHRLFCDRLVDGASRRACADAIADVARVHFGGVDLREALAEPLLFSDWLGRHYRSEDKATLSSFIRAKLKVFYEEELDVPLVVFDDVIDHVLRIDRVLKQPMGHLLLVGDAGVGKTVLSRFSAWMNGLSIFQVKAHANYGLEVFDEDLRACMRRVGVRGEKLCFIFDESNALDSGFLERMNALLASGDVPGLFEGDELSLLLSQCREAPGQGAGVAFAFDSSDSDEDLFRKFTRRVQRHLHVIFTMNPATADFQDRSTTSPALYNRCVVDWFGTWSETALAQVGFELGAVDTDLGASEESSVYEAPRGSGDALSVVEDLLDPGEPMSLRHALTAALVQVHKHVQVAAVGTTRYLSPRDYLELLRSFARVAREKRASLEDQAMHIGQGLGRLEEASASVAELQQSMQKKSAALEEQDAAANEKLQQMVAQQNAAERRKTEADRLRTELEQSSNELAEKKAPIEKELEDVEPTLRAAQSSVESIKKPQLDEVRTLSRPPAAVKATLEMVMAMLGESAKDWTEVRKVLRRDDFISSVVNYDPERVTPAQIRKVRAILAEAEGLDEDAATRASKACGPLFSWAQSQIQYAEILGRIQPLRIEVAGLEQAAQELEVSRDSVMAEISGLEETIAGLKEEYAAMIATSAKLKAEMEDVSARVTRATQLLGSLASEEDRWRDTQAQFQERMRTLCGDALLGAAFLTYAGGFHVALRKQLGEAWRGILTQLGIPHREHLDVFEWVLPKQTPDLRVQWQAKALPRERSSFENAVIFHQGNRYPLVLDADGVARAWVRSQVDTEVSFASPQFTQTLVQAVRFGQALLVTDVAQHDPVINPILNRELVRTGGRVCLSIAGDDVDFNPDFRVVLLHTGGAHSLPPDLQSRVTVVDWRISEEGLRAWAVDEVLEQQDTALLERKKGLVEDMAREGFRLREMEKALLEQISSSEGDLLADDSLLATLQTIKDEYSQTQTRIADGEKVLEELRAQEQRWAGFGGAVAGVWEVLVGLATAAAAAGDGLALVEDDPKDCTYIFDDLAEFRATVRAGVQAGSAGTDDLEGALRSEILRRVWTRLGTGLHPAHYAAVRARLMEKMDAALPSTDGSPEPVGAAKDAGKPLLVLEDGGAGALGALGAGATLSLGTTEAREEALRRVEAWTGASTLTLVNVHYDRELLDRLATLPQLPAGLALTAEPSRLWRHYPTLLRRLYLWRRQPTLGSYLVQLPGDVTGMPGNRLRRYYCVVAVYYICVNKEERKLPPMSFTFPALALPADDFEGLGLPLLEALWREGEAGDDAETAGAVAYARYIEYLESESIFPLSLTQASEFVGVLEELEAKTEAED